MDKQPINETVLHLNEKNFTTIETTVYLSEVKVQNFETL